ncbi:MAG: IS200/IS605 family transposase [Bacteroidetes bacterium]|jgi:REP element-mobilizing transposase RayT|nr:IS200/IS605 family transposase [Bacteroidota bacterium]
MSRYIHKSHNVSILLYHIVCPAKYRRVIFDAVVDYTLRDTCLEIEKRYEIEFLEIGTDEDHVHFLVQSVPTYSPTKLVRTIKSITARQVRGLHPEVRKELWGGKFWSEGYFIATVGRHASEEVIRRYVEEQGRAHEYEQLHKGQAGQFGLFDNEEG